jgi:hypothetical protein
MCSNNCRQASAIVILESRIAIAAGVAAFDRKCGTSPAGSGVRERL